MKKKLLAMLLSFTLIATLAACGTSASAETAAEKAAAREDVTRAEWSLGDIAALSEVVTGITDREYAVDEGAAYKIYEDVTYDRGVVYTVLFNTASVRFDAPGEYPMTYWVYFDAAALKAWADENGAELDIPDADRLAVAVRATVTVTDPEEDEGDEADEAPEETEAAGAVIGSSGGNTESGSGSAASGSSSNSSGGSSKSSGSSSKSSGSSGSSSKSGSSGSSSKSSGNSGSQAAGCSHVWVEVTEEVAVREGRYVCNNCGYSSTDGKDVASHATHVCNCGYSAKSVVVGTQTVGTGTYVCSKCGATK